MTKESGENHHATLVADLLQSAFDGASFQVRIDYNRLKPESRPVIRGMAEALEKAYFERVEK